VEWEITEFSLNQRVSGKSIMGPIAFSGGYEFSAKDASTLVTKYGAVHLSGVLSFIPRRMADALLIDDFQNAIGRLKRLLERQTKAYKRS
jgi:hypothetical protein